MLIALIFCGLMQMLHINHNPLDWQLFIDSSRFSLKAVLFHYGKTLPSIPVGHSVHNKESYENMKIQMEAVNYNKFKWQICGDLKVIALLLRLQQGFVIHCCFQTLYYPTNAQYITCGYN